ncbi:MAG: carbamoyltransferase HypF [bacterium]|nr:carbamoyltransferase HypF [bacterium]
MTEVTEYCAIRVQGIVQGVGFRPFVFRLAHELGLEGTVANDAGGVSIRLGGTKEHIEEFVRRLRSSAPVAAHISGIDLKPLSDCTLAPGFHILASSGGALATAAISPDLATCPDCVAEIFDPANRRFRYPFTNCTNCGPRFTITARIPYDRPNTSMGVFPMCAECSREYGDPFDRRFHAQPNACPVCGPQLSWHGADGRRLEADPILAAAQGLQQGAVVAIKGLGGFHLAVDAANSRAVLRLRERKNRPAKPLAIMVADIAAARRLCRVSALEAELLESVAHPIVLLQAKEKSGLAPALAPGLSIIGLMLAYTPLHHLLLAQAATPKALVMTSGNAGGSPICTGNDEALQRLQGLADFFLLHNRDILTRVDDSVMRVMAGLPRLIRRGRGFAPAPAPLPLAKPCPNTLACGAAMKNTFCIVRNNEAYLSQHIGELSNTENYDFYLESIAHLQEVLECAPNRLACDLHPDYISSRYAGRQVGLFGRTGKVDKSGQSGQLIQVQHHHAHALAVMAEHGLDETVLALILDGAGYGGDGTVFGGEIYQVTRAGYQRLAHLAPLPLPGGDQAVLEPWRLGLALFRQSTGDHDVPLAALPHSLAQINPEKRAVIAALLQKGLNCPPSSSAGRLFDAVSALLGLCLFSSYEGQAAMLLEAQASLAGSAVNSVVLPLCIENEAGIRRIATKPMAKALLKHLSAGRPVATLAWAFHHWLAESCREAIAQLSEETGLTKVVVAGGCMQNKVLFEMLQSSLSADGFAVLSGSGIPMNDGGIALGQAYYYRDKDRGDEPCV